MKSSAQELYDLLPENPALLLGNWREIIDRVHKEFDKAETAAQRDVLLRLFTSTMDIVEGFVDKNELEKFREARRKDYNIFIVQECLVREQIDAKTLAAVTRREIETGRMTWDCRPSVGGPRPTAQPIDSETARLNADVDHQRREAASGRATREGAGTVLLYRPSGHPDQIGISKVDPPVQDGAFLLDFSRPLTISRRFLGFSSSRIGVAVEMLVPVVHEGQRPGTYKTHMHSSDPRFAKVRTLFKARYPSSQPLLSVDAVGFKIIRDFATQFPGDC